MSDNDSDSDGEVKLSPKCTLCKQTKPAERFYINTNGKLHGRCKTCYKRVQSERQKGTYEGKKTRGTVDHVCKKCGVEKEFNDFPVATNKLYHGKVCKACIKAANPCKPKGIFKLTEEQREKIKRWVRKGRSFSYIGAKVGKSKATILNWKTKYPEFFPVQEDD